MNVPKCFKKVSDLGINNENTKVHRMGLLGTGAFRDRGSMALSKQTPSIH